MCLSIGNNQNKGFYQSDSFLDPQTRGRGVKMWAARFNSDGCSHTTLACVSPCLIFISLYI